MVNFPEYPENDIGYAHKEGSASEARLVIYSLRNQKIIQEFAAWLDASLLKSVPICAVQMEMSLRSLLAWSHGTMYSRTMLGRGWVIAANVENEPVPHFDHVVVGRGLAIAAHLRQEHYYNHGWVISTEGEVYSYREPSTRAKIELQDIDLSQVDDTNEYIQGKLTLQHPSVAFTLDDSCRIHDLKSIESDEHLELLLNRQIEVLNTYYRRLTET